MRLRNKKTGGIVDFLTIDLTNKGEIEFCFIAPDGDERGWKYNSLEAFNEEWEDYKPAEPLIKDEKIRKAVRAWAEANQIKKVKHDACWNAFRSGDFVIDFDYDFDRLDGLKDNKSYTVTELCGEEEE